MRRSLAIILLGLLVLSGATALLSACNTTAGVGRTACSRHSAKVYGSLGNPLRCGRSSSSSSARRVTPSRRIGRSSLSWSSSSPIAALSSARL